MCSLVSFGARLKEERERLGLKQPEFARVGGVNRNSQSAYETGKTPATVEYLLSVESLGVDLGYVLWGARGGERLSPAETELLASFAALEEQEQSSLLTVAGAMSGRARPKRPNAVEAPAPTPAQALPPTIALERMFLGLLKSMPNVSEDELAHGLARLLPTGLRTIEGPLRYEMMDDRDDAGDDHRDRPATDHARRRA